VIKNILLLILAAIPYALGWIAGKVARAARWVWKTVKWGWDDAHKKRPSKQVT
jgi:hypothetical protein